MNFSNVNSNFYKKQRQTYLKLFSTLFIFFIPLVHAEFHYANENPNGGVRQFVDSQDFTTQQPTKEDNLPDCSQIPNLLCCTSRVLQKCYDGCLEHVRAKCAHKLRQVDHFQAGNHFVDHDISQQPLPAALDNDADLLHRSQQRYSPVKKFSTTTVKSTTANPTKITTAFPTLSSNLPLSTLSSKHLVDADLPSGGGFIEPLISEVPSAKNAIRITDTTRDHVQKEAPSGDKCGTAESTPAFLPCYSRQVADSLFGKCCRESVPIECRSLCTYEHREDVAAKALIAAVQDRQCDLKWLSAILFCANQNRDNRPCCRHLNLASPELGVGDRCLRMCNVDEKGTSVGTIDQRDLVCLSNWNVIMYCARSGVRSLARFH